MSTNSITMARIAEETMPSTTPEPVRGSVVPHFEMSTSAVSSSGAAIRQFNALPGRDNHQMAANTYGSSR